MMEDRLTMKIPLVPILCHLLAMQLRVREIGPRKRPCTQLQCSCNVTQRIGMAPFPLVQARRLAWEASENESVCSTVLSSPSGVKKRELFWPAGGSKRPKNILLGYRLA